MNHKLSPSAPVRALLLGLSLASASLSSLAQATATVEISNVTVQVIDLTPDDGIWPWAWVVNNVDWAPTASSAMAQIPGGFQESDGWLGAPLSAVLTGNGASASASTGANDFSSGDGGSASASARAQWGASAWSVAQLFGGEFIAGAGTEVVVTADVQFLAANGDGGSAMALASLGIGSADGSRFDSSQAWIFDGPNFTSALAPSTLTVRWDNDSDSSATGQLLVDVSAQALSVPEPRAAEMVSLAVLVGIVALRRRASSKAGGSSAAFVRA